MVTGALVMGLSLAGVGVASASLSPNPDAGWGVNGTVFTVAHLGNTVYVGGHFTAIVSNDASQPSLPAKNLAAFDATTGEPLPWRPTTTGGATSAAGEVYGITPSPDGTRIYISGAFTIVNGLARHFVAAVDPTNGVVDAGFKPSFSYRVHTVLPLGDRVYVGGDFASVNGVPRDHLAALDTNGNVVTGWRADTLGTYLGTNPPKKTTWHGRVVSIAPAADGQRLFVAGDFTAVNGVARRSLAAVNISDGSTDTTFNPSSIELGQIHRGQQIFDLEVLPDRVYVAMGGRSNYLAAYDVTDGHRVRFMNADGDLQSLTRIDSTLYIAGHFDVFSLQERHRLAAVNMTTGKVDPWAPTTNTYFGVWSIDASADRLFAGGEFTLVNGNVPRAHFARFSSDTGPPSVPTGLTATSTTDHSVDLSWDPSTDDQAVVGYDVYQNGTKVGSTTTATTFTAGGLSPQTSYSFQVEARDAVGNLSGKSAALQVTTPPLSPVEVPQVAAGSATPTSAFVDWSVSAGADVASFDITRTDGINPPQVVHTATASERSWTDTSVSASTTYAYDVVTTATDGRKSESGTASATTPAAKVLFQDDFERGTLANWTSATPGLQVATVDPAEAVSGTHVASSKVSGVASVARRTLAAPSSDVTFSLHLRVGSLDPANKVILLRLKQGSAVPFTVFLRPNGTVGYHVNGLTGTTTTQADRTSTTSLADAAWHLLSLHTVIAADGTVTVETLVDRMGITSLTRTEHISTAGPVTSVEMGDDAQTHNFALTTDDVSVTTP